MYQNLYSEKTDNEYLPISNVTVMMDNFEYTVTVPTHNQLSRSTLHVYAIDYQYFH